MQHNPPCYIRISGYQMFRNVPSSGSVVRPGQEILLNFTSSVVCHRILHIIKQSENQKRFSKLFQIYWRIQLRYQKLFSFTVWLLIPTLLLFLYLESSMLLEISVLGSKLTNDSLPLLQWSRWRRTLPSWHRTWKGWVLGLFQYWDQDNSSG